MVLEAFPWSSLVAGEASSQVTVVTAEGVGQIVLGAWPLSNLVLEAASLVTVAGAEGAGGGVHVALPASS